MDADSSWGSLVGRLILFALIVAGVLIWYFLKKYESNIESTSARAVRPPKGWNETVHKMNIDGAPIRLAPLSLPGHRCCDGSYMSLDPSYLVTATGINPSTKRKNTRHIKVNDLSLVEGKMKDLGLEAPFHIIKHERTTHGVPSERQLEYARDLGIVVPPGACFADVSVMISRVEETEDLPPPVGFARFAQGEGDVFSSFCDWECLQWAMSERTRIFLFIHAVHIGVSGGSLGNPKSSPYWNIYISIYDAMISNERFMKSFRENCSDILRAHKGSNAYKIALSLLQDNGLLG